MKLTDIDRSIWARLELNGSNARFWDAAVSKRNLSNLPLVLTRLSNGRIKVAEAVRNAEEARVNREWMEEMTGKFGHGGI